MSGERDVQYCAAKALLLWTKAIFFFVVRCTVGYVYLRFVAAEVATTYGVPTC